MKANFFSLMLSLVTTTTAIAAPNSSQIKAAVESQTTCDTLLRFDDQSVYFGSRNQLHIVSVANPQMTTDIDARADVVDVVRTGETLWVLTQAGLEEWNLRERTAIKEHPTTTAGGPYGFHAWPHAMALSGNRLVIAHGRLGFSIFDLSTKTIVHEGKLVSQGAKQSTASGVASSNGRAYFVLDNYTLANPDEKPAFRGIVTLDVASGQIMNALDGMDPGVDNALTDGSKLIVAFIGTPIWKYDLGGLSASSLPSPQARIWKYPVTGHPFGKAAMDDVNYYTCISDPQAGTRRPVALDRKTIHLD